MQLAKEAKRNCTPVVRQDSVIKLENQPKPDPNPKDGTGCC